MIRSFLVRFPIAVAVVILTLIVAFPVRAAPLIAYAAGRDPVQGVDAFLYTIDLNTGAIGQIGVIAPGEIINSLAIDNEGNLFGIAGGGKPVGVYEINTETGEGTVIGVISRDIDVPGIDFLGDTLIAIDDRVTPTIFSINLDTFELNDIVTTAERFGNAVSMVIVDDNSAIASSGETPLASIDLATGEVTVIDLLERGVHGLDFARDGNFVSGGDKEERNSEAICLGVSFGVGDPHFGLCSHYRRSCQKNSNS